MGCCSKGPRHTVSEPVAQAAGCGAAGLRPAGGDGSPAVFSWPGGRPHRAPCILGSLGGPGAQRDPSRDGRVSLRPRLPGDRSPHLLGLGGSRPRPCAELESGDYLGGPLAVFLPCGRLQGGTGGAGVRPTWGSRAALPRLQVLGPPAPLKVQTDGMRAFLPEAPAGRSPSRSPGLLRPHTMHPAHVGLVCRPWDKKYWPSETLWPLGRSGQGLKPLKKMAAERTDV